MGHVVAYYSGLRNLSIYLTNWRPAGKAKPILETSDQGTARELLLNGQNRRDIGGGVISELGYSMMIWNGDRGFTAQSCIQCGLFSKIGELKNVCSLILSHSLARELGESNLLGCLTHMVTSWNPDKGSAYVYVDHGDSDSEEPATAVLLEYVRGNARSRHGDAEVAQTENGAIYRDAAAIQEVLG